MILNMLSCPKNISNYSNIKVSSPNSTADVLDLIKALRNERSEDIQDKIMDDLQNKKPANSKKH